MTGDAQTSKSTEVTAHQQWEFDCKGFVLIEKLVDTSLIASLLQVAAGYEQPHYSQTSNLLGREPIFREMIFHPGVDSISRQFFGDYRIKGSVLVINPAKEKRTGGIEWPGWHQDADHGTHSYYATASPCPLFQLRFFVALTDVTCAGDGGLALYPGSHRTKLEWPFDRKDVPAGCEVPAMSAGDCLLMHHATLHTALPNESDKDRINVQVLTTPLWIRSNEAEMASAETLEALTDSQRARVITDKW